MAADKATYWLRHSCHPKEAEATVSEQFKSALIRALIISVVTGIGTALTTWATTDETKTILIAGGTAFVTTFLARFGGEGAYDTQRDRRGEVHKGDVNAQPGAA